MKSNDDQRIANGRKPRGAVLVAVLVCLLIVMLLSAALVRGLVVQHRLAKAEPQKLQAFWVAESAVQRGIAQLQASAEYDGETWQIELVQDGVTVSSTAVIRVEPVEGEPDRRTILVEARLPDDPVYGVLEQRQITIGLAKPDEAP
jgi:hypothetical protein